MKYRIGKAKLSVLLSDGCVAIVFVKYFLHGTDIDSRQFARARLSMDGGGER